MCMHACVYTLMNTSMCVCAFRKFGMLRRVCHCVLWEGGSGVNNDSGPAQCQYLYIFV